jgi:putative acyl-CoA dehydrogenase
LRALVQDADAARGVLRALTEEADGLPGAREAETLVTSTLSGSGGEAYARAAVERLALLAAAAAMRGSAPAMVVELFARTRLAGQQGAMFGTSNIGAAEGGAILLRALPA